MKQHFTWQVLDPNVSKPLFKRSQEVIPAPVATFHYVGELFNI